MSAAKTQTATPIDDLKRRIAVEQEALDDLKPEALQLQAARKAALLADSDQELEDVEAAISANLRRGERRRARLDALLAELEMAEEEQRHQEALADFQRAAVQIAEAAAWLMNRYGPLAAEMAAGLATLKAADQLAERMNRQLPAGCAPLRPPSNARHVGREPDRREVQKRVVWTSQGGHEIRGGIQLDADGNPNIVGARKVEREEEVLVTGRAGWFPRPIYEEVALPALERDKPDFWRP